MSSVRAAYERNLQEKRAISFHLPRLKEMASLCEQIVELGVGTGGSSSAFLMGLPNHGKLISCDKKLTARAIALKDAAGDKWTLMLGDSAKMQPVPCDLLFVDSLHTYEHVRDELAQHGASARTWIIFHDTITFGTFAAVGESGKHVAIPGPGAPISKTSELGVRQAVDEWMMLNKNWRIAEHDWRSHGLLILKRDV